MKANEAPEKIYMTPSFGEPDNVLLASFSKSHLDFHRDIEYTRTDAFIERASEWLCDNYDKYIRAIGSSIYPAYLDLCKDFQNYMKGE